MARRRAPAVSGLMDQELLQALVQLVEHSQSSLVDVARIVGRPEEPPDLLSLSRATTLLNKNQLPSVTVYTDAAQTFTAAQQLNATQVWGGQAAPALSAAGTAKFYFDSTSNKARISENGGAFADLGGGGGGITGTLVAGEVAYATGASAVDSDAQLKWTTATKTFTLGDGGTTKTRMVHNSGSIGADTAACELTANLGTAGLAGHLSQVTSSGSGQSEQASYHATLNAGYTGTGSTRANRGVNAAEGTGTTLNIGGTPEATGNFGASFESNGAGAAPRGGVAAKVFGAATGIQFGVLGDALGTGAADNIGVWGNAHPTNGTRRVGGYFGLHSATPTFVSAALVGDNGAVAVPSLIARDNGTEVMSVQDGGQLRSSTNGGVSFRNLAGTEAMVGFPLRQTTTNSAAATEMSIDDAGVVFLPVLATGETWLYEVHVAARATAGTNAGKVAGYIKKFVIERTTATTRIVAESGLETVAEEIVGWDLTVVADDTNDRPVVKVTGDAATTINWRGWAKAVKVS